MSNKSKEEDFSVSEDEWTPKSKSRKFESSDTDSDSDFIEQPARKRKSTTTPKMKLVKKRILSFKQNQIQNLTRKAINIKSQQNTNAENGELDSESSGDEHLVPLDQIDLSAEFYKISDEKPPNKSQNICRPQKLYESEDYSKSPNKNSQTLMDSAISIQFKDYEKFNNILDDAKNQLQNYVLKEPNVSNSTADVSTLLTLGEACNVLNQQINKERITDDYMSDSDEWEEVREISQKVPTNIEIVTKEPVSLKKNNRLNHFLILLKTAINKKKREARLNMHKTHILCLIGHGNYLNSVLNNKNLQKMCLKYITDVPKLPNKNSIKQKNLESIIDWFHATFKLKSLQMNCALNKLPPLPISLALQAQTKSIISKRDFILLFILLLRAKGFQCRLIFNLVTVPIRPLQSELCPIKIEESEKSSKFIFTEAPEEFRFKEDTDTKKKETISGTVKKKVIRNMVNKQQSQKKLSNQEENNKKNEIKSHRVSFSQISLSPSSIKKETKSCVVKLTKLKSVKSTLLKTTPKKRGRNRKENYKVFEDYKTKNISKTLKKSTENSAFTRIDENINFSQIDKPDKGCKKFFIKLTKPQRSGLRSFKCPQLDGATSNIRKPNKKPSKKVIPSEDSDFDIAENSNCSSSSADTEDSDFNVPPPKKRAKPSKKPIQRQKINSDKKTHSTGRESKLFTEDEKIQTKKDSIDYWIEIYLTGDKIWIPVMPNYFHLKINSVDNIRKCTSKPIRYVLAWNNDNTIKDVSARYCKNWNTALRLLRVPQEWMAETLKPYNQYGVLTSEDRELDKISVHEPLPSVITEYKNHPLYALKRHLLKFEVIYPPNALTLGYIRNEPVYSRDCVYKCKAREIWFREARVVKIGEKPYKIVKDRPKWDPATRTIIKNLSLDIFGIWQTEPYEPPVAQNGIVPRNAYGNVDFYKPEMLPKNTIHLRLSGLNRTCKKLGIDCANAFVGWKFTGMNKPPPNPFDGYIICEEFKEKVIRQWEFDQQEAKRKGEEKRNQRIYGNWKKLIKGLLIRQRLQRKYNFQKKDKRTK